MQESVKASKSKRGPVVPRPQKIGMTADEREDFFAAAQGFAAWVAAQAGHRLHEASARHFFVEGIEFGTVADVAFRFR